MNLIAIAPTEKVIGSGRCLCEISGRVAARRCVPIYSRYRGREDVS